MMKSITNRILAFAVALVVCGPALAGFAGSPTKDPSTDNSGFMALGVDISPAGNTPQSVGAFFDTLPKARQRSLVYGCRSTLEAPAYANRDVLRFCGVLVQVTRDVPPASPPPHLGG